MTTTMSEATISKTATQEVMNEERSNEFSLRGKKLEQQKEIVKEAIDYHQKELDKWIKKLQEVNEKIDESDWKKFTERFSIDEIYRRLQQNQKK